MIGETVSHYRILDRLGEGGMGQVYEAEDLRLGRKVAIKVLPPRFAQDRERRARFEREARAASRLDHPNVGVVYEIGDTDDGALFIAMARYPGGTLRDRLDDGALDVPEARQIAVGLANGLAAAHRAGVVHRDVKPANIVVTDEGLTKVIDFGIAKLADADPLTQAEVVTGSAHYMAPEQAQAGDVDARADVWAIGVVLYEMLAGRRPFDGAYSAAVLYQVTHETPPPLSDFRPDVPDELAAVVTRCLQKDPDARYADAGEVADALGVDVAPRLTPTRRVRWRSWAAVAAVVSVALVGAALAWGAAGASANDLYELGAADLAHHYDDARLTSAIDYFERSLAIDSTSAEAHAAISEAFVRQGVDREDSSLAVPAQEHAARALQLAPRLPEARIAHGLVNLWADEPSDALREFQQALYLDSTEANAWIGMGDAYLAMGESDAAINAYGGAIRTEPGSWFAHHRLGYARATLGDYSAAAKSWERVVELAPDNSKALLNRGSMLFYLERFGDAAAVFHQLVSKMPDGDIYSNLATSLFYSGDYEQAVDQYQRALRYDPGDHEKLGYLASALWESGRRAEARRVFTRADSALRSVPDWDDSPLLTTELASYAAALGDRRVAESLITEATNPTPESVYALVNVASAYGWLGQRAETIRWTCRAIQAGYSPLLTAHTPVLADFRNGGWERCIKTESLAD